MPLPSQSVVITVSDATRALPSPTYNEIIVVGEDPNKLNLFNQVKTYYSQSEVEADFGADSPISKATAKIFAQGVDHLKVVNVMKDDGAGGSIADYDTVLAALESNAVDYDLMCPTIGATDSNISKLVDHANTYKKLLVIPDIGDASTVQTNFGALTANEFCFAVAHDDSGLEKGELAGAVVGVIAKLNPWIWTRFQPISGVDAAGYTPSELTTLENNNINTLVTESGLGVMLSDGKMLDGGWIDVSRCKVYLTTELKTDLVNLLVRTAAAGSRIPYEPQGLATIKARIEQTLRSIQALGAIRQDYVDSNGNLVRGFEVIVPSYESIPESDKNARILKNVHVTAYFLPPVGKIEMDLVLTI
ncbi:hypothetical protein DRP05_08635 [Archaeoglobales archaeon]|nr:MAG: hypothetical protein DRP05_08635 [Archaeoglobales archaeon]